MGNAASSSRREAAPPEPVSHQDTPTLVPEPSLDRIFIEMRSESFGLSLHTMQTASRTFRVAAGRWAPTITVAWSYHDPLASACCCAARLLTGLRTKFGLRRGSARSKSPRPSSSQATCMPSGGPAARRLTTRTRACISEAMLAATSSYRRGPRTSPHSPRRFRPINPTASIAAVGTPAASPDATPVSSHGSGGDGPAPPHSAAQIRPVRSSRGSVTVLSAPLPVRPTCP